MESSLGGLPALSLGSPDDGQEAATAGADLETTTGSSTTAAIATDHLPRALFVPAAAPVATRATIEALDPGGRDKELDNEGKAMVHGTGEAEALTPINQPWP